MLGNRAFFVAAGLGLGLLMVLAQPASAEFFGCNDQHPSRVSYSSRSYSAHSYNGRMYASRSFSSHELAAQHRSTAVYHHSNDPFAFFRNSGRH